MTNNTLTHSTPEAQGIASPAILAFVEAADKDIDSLHSFMLLRHGAVVAQGWWSPYAPEIPHVLFSLSKSFTATAPPIAWRAACASARSAHRRRHGVAIPTESSRSFAAISSHAPWPAGTTASL